MPMEPKVIRKSFSKDAGRYNEPGGAPGGRVVSASATGTPKRQFSGIFVIESAP